MNCCGCAGPLAWLLKSVGKDYKSKVVWKK